MTLGMKYKLDQTTALSFSATGMGFDTHTHNYQQGHQA